MELRVRRTSLLVVGLLIVAACGGSESVAGPDTTTSRTTIDGSSNDQPESTTTNPIELTEQASNALAGDGHSALDGLRTGMSDELPEPLIDLSQVTSVIPPDQIPSIDQPAFVSVTEADAYLEDDEPVVIVDIAGDVRAYPVQILIWHEIVNDVVGGNAVAVTYCPLCNSAVTYDRTIDGTDVTFGTSGSLFNSALVMYDRTTESLWTHYDGTAVAGELTGVTLPSIPSPLLAWADFKSEFPDAIVLDRNETGANRSYGTNPYVGYDDDTTAPFLFRGTADERAALLERVVGIEINDAKLAWTLEGLTVGEATATAGTVGGTDLVIFWKAGQSSALDRSSTFGGKDVGSVGVFSSTLDGDPLTFTTDGDAFIDDQTGSVWTITGRAQSGTLEGRQLERIVHLDTFWFAWSAYRGGTELIEP